MFFLGSFINKMFLWFFWIGFCITWPRIQGPPANVKCFRRINIFPVLESTPTCDWGSAKDVLQNVQVIIGQFLMGLAQKNRPHLLIYHPAFHVVKVSIQQICAPWYNAEGEAVSRLKYGFFLQSPDEEESCLQDKLRRGILYSFIPIQTILNWSIQCRKRLAKPRCW